MRTILSFESGEVIIPHITDLCTAYSDSVYVCMTPELTLAASDPDQLLSIGRACFQAAERLTEMVARRARDQEVVT